MQSHVSLVRPFYGGLGTRWRAERPSPFLRFELFDECGEMQGNGSRRRDVLVFEALHFLRHFLPGLY